MGSNITGAGRNGGIPSSALGGTERVQSRRDLLSQTTQNAARAVINVLFDTGMMTMMTPTKA